jgi:hypothetical protein
MMSLQSGRLFDTVFQDDRLFGYASPNSKLASMVSTASEVQSSLTGKVVAKCMSSLFIFLFSEVWGSLQKYLSEKLGEKLSTETKKKLQTVLDSSRNYMYMTRRGGAYAVDFVWDLIAVKGVYGVGKKLVNISEKVWESDLVPGNIKSFMKRTGRFFFIKGTTPS